MAQSKGFFAVDIVQFEKIRSLNLGIEEAATYLSLLAGSDQSNTFSSWGIQGIRRYTGFTRAEAQVAVYNLVRSGLIEELFVKNKHTRTKPRYRLPIHESRSALSGKEKAILETIASGAQPSNKGEAQAAHRAKHKGWLARDGAGWKVAEHSNEVAFIPNSFVISDDGNAPLRRLIINGELDPIMLAVELYEKQNIMNQRGVPISAIRGYWQNEKVSYIGSYKLHRLERGRCYIDSETAKESNITYSTDHVWRTPNLWETLNVLDSAHVIEWTIYSANGKPSDSRSVNRPQRPLGVLRNGKQVKNTPESIPAFLSFIVQMLIDGEVDADEPLALEDLVSIWMQSSPVIAIENTSVSHVEGVGILRMVLRADTVNNKVWYKELCEESDLAVFFLEQVIQTQFPQISDKIDVIRSSLEA